MHLPWRYLHLTQDGPPISTSITESETAKLKDLAHGKIILEVGSAYGYSAVAMALAGAIRVYAVDPHAMMNSYTRMVGNVSKHLVTDKIRIRSSASQYVLPELVSTGIKFGMAFIDGDHSFETVNFDVSWALRLLNPGGVLACHDYLEDCCCPGVKMALDELIPDGPDEVVDTLAVYYR